MTVLAMTGFEAAAVAVDNFRLNGTSAYSTAQVRTGSRSVRCDPASGVAGNIDFPYWTGGGTIHFGLYIASLPSVTRGLCGAIADGVSLTSTGTLEFRDGGTLIGTSSTALTTGVWYWLGVRYSATTGSDAPLVQINGTTEITGQFAGALAMVIGPNDTEASAIDIYIDDVIQETIGSFLAPSKVALLLPISDNARAEWTAGSGGTTNLYDAVDNVPPAGLATESNTSQIEHPGGGISSYSANMTTYATAGVGSSDTVLAIQGMVVWGEDSATGTKLLTYYGEGNPGWTGESSIDVSTGDGSGATLNYAAGPPDYWNERRSAIKTTDLVIGTNITLSNSEKMAVSRGETASRVASVCFMGMYVAWTPYVAPPVSMVVPRKVYPQLLPH